MNSNLDHDKRKELGPETTPPLRCDPKEFFRKLAADASVVMVLKMALRIFANGESGPAV